MNKNKKIITEQINQSPKRTLISEGSLVPKAPTTIRIQAGAKVPPAPIYIIKKPTTIASDQNQQKK